MLCGEPCALCASYGDQRDKTMAKLRRPVRASEELEWHECGNQVVERTLRIRELNDAVRTAETKLVRRYRDLFAKNDPYFERDFGISELDGETFNWKRERDPTCPDILDKMHPVFLIQDSIRRLFRSRR
jgi:hypothetical protein